MWNLTPDYIQQVKDELRGRRAAVEARYADELKAIAADLDDIETLERVAHNFAAKHLPDAPSAVPAGERPAEMAILQPAAAEPLDEESPTEVQSETRGGLSRLVRLDT
jgi:hypothetical protein